MATKGQIKSDIDELYKLGYIARGVYKAKEAAQQEVVEAADAVIKSYGFPPTDTLRIRLLEVVTENIRTGKLEFPNAVIDLMRDQADKEYERQLMLLQNELEMGP